MRSKFNLPNKNIRKTKPGFSEKYYKIIENLDEYFLAILLGLGVEAVTVKRLAGETNINIYFKTNLNEELVLRISPWNKELLTSSIFYDLLTKNKIPSPKVIKYDSTLKIIPFEYQIISYIKHDKFNSTYSKQQMGKAYGKILKKMHRIKTPGYGKPKNENEFIDNTWEESLQRAYLQSTFLRVKSELYSKDEISQIETLFTKENIAITQPYLIHGDVSVNNVLFRMGRNAAKVAAIIDPGSLISGDPLFDIAMLVNDNDEFSKATLHSYGISGFSDKQNFRLRILRLLCSYWTSCYLASVKGRPKRYIILTRELVNNTIRSST
ncbi:MAG: aminoglycoside phosphotransferase family protein [Candidatus Dojkabacteria bacterium]|jgi:aminoglycoside phosphotransferase (APT) family kinase protein|nr:aminoglycoside phosphotransferase family protein [Candidatus Dojkabacteria bacterium]